MDKSGSQGASRGSGNILLFKKSFCLLSAYGSINLGKPTIETKLKYSLGKTFPNNGITKCWK